MADTNTIPPSPKQPPDAFTVRNYEVGPQGGYFKGTLYHEHDIVRCTQAQASRTWTEKVGAMPHAPSPPEDTDPKTMHGAQQHKK